MTILYFIIALGILVLVHEWGHFIVARKMGIRVDEFSIGFGPKLFGIKGKVTEYKVCLLPFGGFVKLYGEDPVAESDGDEAKAENIAKASDSFSGKPVGARLATVFAGPGMNLLFSLILLPLVFMVGRQMPAILEQAPVVLGVRKDSPAQIAGFQKGDQIVAIDGRAMTNWTDVLNWVIVHPATDGRALVRRDSKETTLSLKTIQSPHIDSMVGYAGFEPQYFWDNEAIIGELSPNGPAEAAGLKPGDQIIAINDKPIETWTDLTEIVHHSNGVSLQIRYQRGGEVLALSLHPTYHEVNKVWLVGIAKKINPNRYVTKKYALIPAVREGMKEYLRLLQLTGDVLGRLFTGQLSYKALGGPLQIAQATGVAAKNGFSEFLFFMAFLSMQLGVMNLLPIPVLDGGHVLFMAIEGIRRKPLSMKLRNTLMYMGLSLLLTLMVLVTINDIDRIWNFQHLWESFRGIF